MSDPNNPNHPPVNNARASANEADEAHSSSSPAGEPFLGDPDGLAEAIQAEDEASDGAGDGDPRAEILELQAQLAEEKERYIRAMAEMENVRRRAADEVTKAHKFSIESFAEALIPVADSLEMALKVETPTVESLKEGVEATLRQLSGAFERNRLVNIDPLGEKFNPNQHQAISMMPASATNPPVEPNHVATVLQKGYLINDRVIRPALVVVAEA
ncbi:MAG: nucleotide exchange factor GrpE [Burkholderiaceae bacterium]